jgi:hypothetical protein
MMLAKRGGYAVQRLYREQGRIGDQHPAHKAAKISVERRKERKMNCEREQQRIKEVPATLKTRHKLLPI